MSITKHLFAFPAYKLFKAKLHCFDYQKDLLNSYTS